MSDQDHSANGIPSASGKPLVCIRAREHGDKVAGRILEAHHAGFDVLVLADPKRDQEAIRIASQLNVEVLEREDANDERTPSAVTKTAKRDGYPGVIFHGNPEKRIDFDRSVDALLGSTDYCIDSKIPSITASDESVLVAIPAFNEGGTIGEVVARARQEVDDVLVIDDGSTDATASEARAAGAVVVEHEENIGYGGALKSALREAKRARVDHLVILDADGQHEPEEISRLVDRQKNSGAELVIGSRYEPAAGNSIPIYRKVGLAVVNLMTNLSLGKLRPSTWVKDTQNGFRLYNKRAIESMSTDPSIGDNMGASTDILHHAVDRGYDIEEVGVSVNYDIENGNSHNPLHHGSMLLGNLLATIEKERPLLLLGIPGFILSCIGIGFSYWTLSNFITTNAFPIGLGITSVFFVLAGVFTTFSAIILHAMKQYLHDFERDL